jgi:integrase
MPRRKQGPRLKWHRYGATFYICWTENGRSRERSTGTADREQAEVALAEWLSTKQRHNGPSHPNQILVTDVLDDYLKGSEQRVADPVRIANAVLPLADFFERLTVEDVTPKTCESYVKKRGKSAGTVRRELGVLRAAINHAHKRGRMTRTVAIELPAPPPARERWLTRAEAARLIRASRTKQARLYMPLFILIALYTGRRKEAILSLRWAQVDLEAGVINFCKPGDNETSKRRGRARIPARLLPHLKRAKLRGTDLGYVVHDQGERIKDIKKGFAAACKRAGIEGATPHTLKHTAATWIMQAGVPFFEASGYLSTSVETLQRVYAHHHPDFQKQAADAIGRKPFRRISA